MIEEQTMSGDVVKLVPDLIKVQNKLKPVKKQEENPYFKTKYASLSSFLEEAQPVLSENNFALIQQLGGDLNSVSLSTIILHTSGAWIKSTLTMAPVKQDPQSVGSCITYARRYGLQTLLGMATEDDDGNFASGKSNVNVDTQTTNKNSAQATAQQTKTSFVGKPKVTKVSKKELKCKIRKVSINQFISALVGTKPRRQKMVTSIVMCR